jgi:maleylacetoacetate isomerase/maleylpyruvate isomerase
MKLHTYFRSSAAYRVRIALNLKSIQAETVPVHLLKDGGEQFSAGYDALNPSHLVPLLEDGGMLLTQSLAIIEYLDETHPQPPYPGRDEQRLNGQQVRADLTHGFRSGQHHIRSHIFFQNRE